MIKNNQPICKTDQYGNKWWYLNNQRHREDGPAVEHIDGYRAWFFNNQYHREDGPAVEYPNGYKVWFVHGRRINCSSQEEFERLIKLKALW